MACLIDPRNIIATSGALVLPALLLLACTDRPAIDSADSTATTTGEPTSTGTDATTIPPTTTTPTTDTPTEPSSSTTAIETATDTTATSTTALDTGTTDATTTGLTATDTGSSTTGDPPPAGCQPCDTLIMLGGPIDIDATTDLSQFGCLGAVSGNLSISGDLTAEQLAPLCHLRSVSQSLSIQLNNVLTDLSPFADLEDVDMLRLWKLPALTAVTGLTSLQKADWIEVNETGATTLGSFAPDFVGIRVVQLFNNAALTDVSALVEWGLSGDSQSIAIHNSAALADISTLTDLFAAAGDNFSFRLLGLPALTSLAGLDATSKGNYEFLDLPLLTDLQPLSTVKSLVSLHLSAIPLTSLAGLDSLQSAHLIVDNMPLLTSLAGLGSFKSGDLILRQLPALTSLAPLPNFTTGRFVYLYDLPLVTSLVGLDKLQTVESLMIGDCVNEGTSGMNGLTDLTGLGALTSAKEFMVTNSAELTSLAGASKLSVVSERLAIINNPKLTKPAFDAFLVQVAEPMMLTCFGDWAICDCIELME